MSRLEFAKEELAPIVQALVAKYPVKEILETGTYMGLGTTQILAATGLPVKTIECNLHHYQHAVNNLKDFPNVECLHGYSLLRSDMNEFISTDDFDANKVGAAIDIHDEARVHFYLNEVAHGDLPEELLKKNLKADQLVFLDSAGGVGWLEFQVVYRSKLPVLLVMDDVDHFKHYRSAEYLLNSGLPIETAGRWGWCYLDRKPQK